MAEAENYKVNKTTIAANGLLVWEMDGKEWMMQDEESMPMLERLTKVV